MKKTPVPELKILREKAEKFLLNIPAKSVSRLSDAEILRLFHELEVHQVELEMQNEELRSAVVIANDATDLYDFAPTGYFTLSRDGVIKMLNLSGAAVLGRERQHLLNIQFSFFVADVSKPVFNHFFERVFNNRTKEICDLVLKDRNSQIHDVQLSGIASENGEQCLVTMVDISDRKRVQNELLQQRWRLESIIESTHLGTWEWNVQTGETVFNEQWAQIIGYSLHELEPINIGVWQKYTHPDDLKQSLILLQKHFTGELPHYDFEFRMKHKDGHWVWIHDRGQVKTWTDDGKPQMMFGTHADITERKLMEEKLRESEHRYRQLVETANEAILVAQGDKFKFVNPIACELTGYTEEEFLSTPFIEFIYPADRALVADNYKKRLNEEIFDQNYIFRFIAKGNNVRWVEMTGVKIDWNGQPAILNFASDITARKQAEQALKESEIKYRELIENLPDAVVIYVDGKVEFANKECLRLMQVDNAEKFIGTSVLQFVHPDSRALVIERMNQASGSGVVLPLMEEKFIRPNGSEVLVEVKAMSLMFENKMAVQLIIRDITKRKQDEEELKNSELNFRELFEANTDGITIFNVSPVGPPSSILDMNENAARMVGYTKGELLYSNPNTLEKDITAEKMERRRNDLLSKGFSNFETIIVHRDGHEIDVEIKVMMINYNNQPALMNIVRDITERKNSEFQLQKYAIELSKQIAEKDKFFSIIAHDLRGPFNGFLELTSLMAEESSRMSMDEVRKIAAVMKKSATNLFRLLGNLLEWSRLQRGITKFDPVPIALNARINDIIALAKDAATKKGIEVNILIPPDLVVLADENMLEGILRNLAANAVKYTNKGGCVTVSATYIPNNFVEFAIKDTGIGMSKEILDNLFNFDINTNRKGTTGELSTGLGLIICKDFIEKNNGTLRIESEPGKGSTFYFTLPGQVETENIAPDTRLSQADKSFLQNRKLNILIAEDEETSDLLISITLANISNEFFHAKTGIEAVDICRGHPEIDLILMDIQMPEMDGYEATRQIRQFNQNVIIIAQTAYTYSNDREMSMNSGCNEYISKPISQAELMELISKLIK